MGEGGFVPTEIQSSPGAFAARLRPLDDRAAARFAGCFRGVANARTSTLVVAFARATRRSATPRTIARAAFAVARTP